MKTAIIAVCGVLLAASAAAEGQSKAKFLNGAANGRTTLSQVIEVLGPPDAVLLLKSDSHPSAKEFREYAPAGDTTERELYWYNVGCQPVIVIVKKDGKVSGVNATYYVRGCTKGLDQYMNLPAEYSCSRKDRAPHCK